MRIAGYLIPGAEIPFQINIADWGRFIFLFPEDSTKIPISITILVTLVRSEKNKISV